MTSPRRQAAIDRDMEQLGEPGQLGRGSRTQHPCARQDHRTPGGGEQLDDGADVFGGRPCRRRASRVGRFELGHLVEEVLREREQDRTRPTGQGLAHGLRHGRRDILRPPGLDGPLGEAAERPDLVDLLERLAPAEVALDLPDEDEHRARVLASGVDADRQVRAADRSRRETGGRSTGQLSVRLRHEGRAALVTSRHDPDAGVAQGIQQPQERLAGHREGIPDTGGTQHIGDEPPNGPRADRGQDLGCDLDTGRGGRHLAGSAAGLDGLGGRLDRVRRVRWWGLLGGGTGDLVVNSSGGVLDRDLWRRSGVELAHGSGVSSAGRRTACVSTPAGKRWPT